MSLVIRVENLGKQYRVGASRAAYSTLRESLYGAMRAPLDLFRRGRRSNGELIWALRDVNFEAQRGEVVGIVGRNGAGKSTLLKVLSRITEPTTGRVELYGRVGSLLEVGTGFHPELSGRENIYLNGAILGMKRAEIERKFDEIVEFAELGRFIDTPVKRYSSGMYVRLAFAVASSLEPDVLVVDEVLAVGDAAFQKKCLGRMRSVTGEGRTVIFVSHNMAAVKALCTRALLLDAGRIVCEGSVDEVVDRYLAGGGEMSRTGVIAEDAPRSGTGEVRLRRVELTNLADEPVSQVYFGQPFRVAVTLEALRETDDAIVCVGISSSDATRVTSSYSTDGGRAPLSLKRGVHRLSVDFEVALLPRQYVFDLSVVRKSGADVDVIGRALQFEALGVAERGADHYPWSTVHGFIRLNGRWRLPQERE